MKKILVFVIIFSFVSPVIFGQNSPKNMVTAGVNLSLYGYVLFLFGYFPLGFNLEYERLLNERFSLSFDIGCDSIIEPYAAIKGRWYPRGNIFFMETGVGILGMSDTFNGRMAFLEPMIPLGIGWRIGNQNGFVIIPAITDRFVINTRHIKNTKDFDDILIDSLVFHLRVGYRF